MDASPGAAGVRTGLAAGPAAAAHSTVLPVLIKACLNGGRAREEHARIPITPEELAADAAAVAALGAGAVHVHPRDRDGRESLAADDCDAALRAIRTSCPGLPVGLTTGARIEPDLDQRLAAIGSWSERPDFASVNFYEDGAVEVARALLDRGIGVEAGLASVDDAHILARSGLGERCLRVLVEVEDEEPARAAAHAAAVDDELRRLAIRALRLHHGVGLATWAVLEAAVAAGRDVRIGLEDTLVLADGTPARDNAELVEEARRRDGR